MGVEKRGSAKLLVSFAENINSIVLKLGKRSPPSVLGSVRAEKLMLTFPLKMSSNCL